MDDMYFLLSTLLHVVQQSGSYSCSDGERPLSSDRRSINDTIRYENI